MRKKNHCLSTIQITLEGAKASLWEVGQPNKSKIYHIQQQPAKAISTVTAKNKPKDAERR